MAQCEPLELHLNPLPGSSIWTGDANQEMSYLKATSFLGGLRFWTEALLRAQGQYVHDDMDSCLYESKKSDKTCAACHIFGCTGLGRSFALKVDNDNFRNTPYTKNPPDTFKVPLKEYAYIDKTGKPKTPQYYARNAHKELVKMHFTIQRAVQEVGCEKVLFTLSPTLLRATLLMLEYGTLGAYDQYGCGFVNFAEQEQLNSLRQEVLATPICYAKNPRESRGASLKDFFFFQGKVKSNNKEMPFILRHSIRDKKVACMQNDGLRHFFCGSLVNDQPQPRGKTNAGSKYNLCVTSSGKLYGWGYFPRNPIQELARYARERDVVLTHTHNIIKNHCDKLLWKEFGAKNRDNCDSPTEFDTYLKDMLTTPWKERV